MNKTTTHLENLEEVKIRAAVVEKRGAQYNIEELTLRDLRHDEVLVKIVATGMCHTDMVAQNEEYGVPYPVVLGHEGAGIVERVGSTVQKVKPGDHVVLTFMSCGRCDSCLKGAPTYCANFFPLNFCRHQRVASEACERTGCNPYSKRQKKGCGRRN